MSKTAVSVHLQPHYEAEFAAAHGYTLVCGTDEAGRGPLCGPVVAAACLLPPDFLPDGLNDSKKLTPKKRDILFDILRENALSYCIAQSSVEEINQYNILEASLLAMRRAIAGLQPQPDAVLVDGNVERGFQIPAKCVISGDATVPSIAAASVLAKVKRDRLCLELDAAYPQYGIAGHKGYGTKAHMDALRTYGPSPIHRRQFIRFLGDDALPPLLDAHLPDCHDPLIWAVPASGPLPPYILERKLCRS